MELFHLAVISESGIDLPYQYRYQIYDTKRKAQAALIELDGKLNSGPDSLSTRWKGDDVLDFYVDGKIYATIWVMDMLVRPVQDNIPEDIRYNATAVARYLTYWAQATKSLHTRLTVHPLMMPKESDFVRNLMDKGHKHWKHKMYFEWPSTN